MIRKMRRELNYELQSNIAIITPKTCKLQPSFHLDIMRNCEGLQSATLLNSHDDIPHPNN